MAGTFHLQIVTPAGLKLDEPVESVIVTTTEGDVEILRNHINYMAAISVGKIKVRSDSTIHRGAISGGFIRVDGETTVVVVEACEWQDDIDVDRATRSQQRAQETLLSSKSPDEIQLAQYRLKKAQNRMKLAEK